MNKIQELIEQLCPNGVEFKELAEVAKISNGKDHKHLEEGEFPVYGSGGIMRYANQFMYSEESVLIPRKGSIGNIFYVNKPFWTVDTIFYTRINTEAIQPKFLYYYLKTLDLKELNFAGGVPSLTKTILDKIIIPTPPLVIQQEIVSILDSFTQLEAELEAELEARRAQYAYYRAKLLNFNNKREGYNWLTLRELCLKTDNVKWKENDNIDFKYIDLSSVDRMSNKITETQIITSQNAPSRAQQIVRNNDVIFGTTRPTLKRYCLITPEYDGQICSTGFCVLRANTEMILPKYLFFVLTTSDFYNYVENNQEGAGYPAISNSKVKEYKMAVPSIEEQNRIVEVLDKFDSLVNDISIGLPAEIDGRRKQYNYYRGKLLDFNV